MFNHYKHTQPGYVILISTALSCLIIGVIMLTLEANLIVVGVLLMIIVATILFASLTIEIKDNFLHWRFGPGLIRKRVPVTDIEHAEAVRNSWLYGWGIHMTPHGWLYNVSGMEAVQIRLKSGRTFRLGTDEPQRLCEAIDQALQIGS